MGKSHAKPPGRKGKRARHEKRRSYQELKNSGEASISKTGAIIANLLGLKEFFSAIHDFLSS